MTTDVNIESLIAEVEEVVARGIAYVQDNAESEVKIDIWTPREVLCHWIYWHAVTAEGMESAAAGEGPHHIYAEVDDLNARSVGRKSGVPVAWLGGRNGRTARASACGRASDARPQCGGSGSRRRRSDGRAASGDNRQPLERAFGGDG